MNNRILEIDLETGATRELLYQVDNRSNGVNEIVAIKGVTRNPAQALGVTVPRSPIPGGAVSAGDERPRRGFAGRQPRRRQLVEGDRDVDGSLS